MNYHIEKVPSRGEPPTTGMSSTAMEHPFDSAHWQPGLYTSERSVMSGIDVILDAREARYGGFRNNSKVSQAIKSSMKSGLGWDKLLPTQQESLDQIASKISRIVSGGDTSYTDSWKDISGYAELVVKELSNES